MKMRHFFLLFLLLPFTADAYLTPIGGGGGGSGTVTTVNTDSTTAGTFVNTTNVIGTTTVTLSYKTQVKNKALLGPTTGSDAAPTFRLLVGADLPLPGASALGGVFSKALVSHQFLTSISSADGSVGQAQPAFSDISGTASTGQIPDLSATYLPLAGGTLSGNVKKGSCYLTPVESDLGNSGTTLAFDLSTANVLTTTLNNSPTITVSSPTTACAYAFDITQDGSGNHTITWAGTTIVWVGGNSTLSTAAGALDTISCHYNGSITKLICAMNNDVH